MVLLLLVIESMVLALAGILIGLLVVNAGAAALSPWLAAEYGLQLGVCWPSMTEWILLGAVLAASVLASLVPGFRAYRYSVADGMTIRI